MVFLYVFLGEIYNNKTNLQKNESKILTNY